MMFPHPDGSVRSPRAGAATADITPSKPVFLYGYPHVPRISTGVSDLLLASALFLDDGIERCLLISVDVIWLSKRQVAAVRKKIASCVDIQAERILIAASHTHSGPTTVTLLSNERDPHIPPPDFATVEAILDGIVAAAVDAVRNAEAAEVGFSDAQVPGIGGNRHDPRGPSASTVPVMAVRLVKTQQLLALHYVFSVHPTVLHEDSTLVSGDFPGIARRVLQNRLADGRSMPVLNHLGVAGNQSPRHAVRANTLAEADRLGNVLADAICTAFMKITFTHDWRLDCRNRSIDLPLRPLPEAESALQQLAIATASLTELQRSWADRPTLRTAECDVFGAEELVTIAHAASTGRLEAVASECMPAEIQAIRINSRQFVAWPGEIFIEFALELRQMFPGAVVITLANGELQGYLVTEEAVVRSWYESANAIFDSPQAGNRLVAATHALLTDSQETSSGPVERPTTSKEFDLSNDT